MKRLVQVIPHYSPPYVGGMEMRARDRAEQLVKAGWFVETLTSSEETYPHTVTDSNQVIRYLRSWEVAHTPIIFSLPAAIMRAPKDSVVHVETALAYSTEIAALMCKLRKMPYVMRLALDTVAHSKLRNILLSFYQRTVLKWAFKNAAIVVVLTADDVALVSEKYGVDPNRIRVIPNASNFRRAVSPREGFHDPFRLLFVGRVVLQKNVPFLLESLRHFVDTYSLPIHLDLVGEGEDIQRVKNIISQLNLQSYVTLRGSITGGELEKLYEAADAFVLTSIREGFGQVVLEAMTKGLPVIASNIRSVRTIVEDGTSGLLVNLESERFAKAFNRLLTEKGLYQRLSRGSLESAKRYTMEETINSYISVYSEVTQRHPAYKVAAAP
jgi:glycosyltransferase involved in cell wall biosynthesis